MKDKEFNTELYEKGHEILRRNFALDFFAPKSQKI